MRVGVNALYLLPGGVGGTEIYLRSLLQAMACLNPPHDFYVFTNRETSQDLVPPHPRFHHRPQNVTAASRPQRILWEQFRLSGQARDLDVLFNPGFTAPLQAPCPNVTVFHDLQHVRHPEFFRWWDLPFWKALLYGSATRSRIIIAVSDATRQDVIRHYGIAPDRVRTIPHGVDEAFFTLPRLHPDSKTILCVSTLHPHKNLDRLLRVFARLHSELPNSRLILAGMKGHHTGALERLQRELNLTTSVEMTGWISRAELYRIYSSAGAFIFPSRFEGFGMPVLEALAMGIPTACSSVEPMKSIAGNAVVFFEPQSEPEMLAALRTVLLDPTERARLETAGPRRARDFTWENAARLTLQALEDACL